MGLVYLLYLTVGLPLGLDHVTTESLVDKRQHYEMLAEVSSDKLRKRQKKQNKKEARRAVGKRRELRRECRRERDVKGYRRSDQPINKQRVSSQKDHSREKMRERNKRKTTDLASKSGHSC